MSIQGHKIELDRNRSVFVGAASDDDLTYIKFINSEGAETRFTISPDARAALVRLLVHPGPVHLKHDGEWTYVIPGEEPKDA